MTRPETLETKQLSIWPYVIDVKYLPALNDCFALFAVGASQSCSLFSLFYHLLWISNADEQQLIQNE